MLTLSSSPSRHLWLGVLLAGTLFIGLTAWSQQPVYQAQTSTTVTANTPQAKQAAAETILTQIIQRNGLDAARFKKITVVDDKALNAATNGQEIVFYRGLWDALSTNDQRAFVIAHEMAHITQGHIGQMQVRRVGLSVLNNWLKRSAVVASKGALVQAAGQAGLLLTDLRFGRQAEYQADDVGIQYIQRAGYTPEAALQTLDVLFKNSASNGGAGPEFLQSHPMERNRMTLLAKKYNLQR